MSSRLIGSQKPRISLVPKRASTDGEDASVLASAYGLTPDEWQRDILDVWLGRDKHDKFTARTCGLTVPRQNGKNALLEMRELYGLCVIGEQILHSAHEVKTAAVSFLRLASFFENRTMYPELADMLLRVRKANGQEAIELINGGRISFSSRSSGANRGMTFDLVVFDEAQELTDEQLEAIMSTMAAAPLQNRQTIYTGTPPRPSGHGEVFGRVRKQALSGDGEHLAWHEWSVKDMPKDVSDKALWYETNPALGIRLDESFTQDECNTMSPDGFARERLGWWPKQSVASAINAEDWDALKTLTPPTEGKRAYGIKFAPDGSVVALAVALKPREGKPHIEVIDHRSMSSGNRWLVDWLTDRWKEASVIVIDGKSGAENLVNALNANKVASKVICLPKVGEVIAACTTLLNDINEMSFTHFDQPALNMAATNARKRPIGDRGGWGWGGINDVDVTPLEAVSLALWGVKTSKRDPTRKQKVAF